MDLIALFFIASIIDHFLLTQNQEMSSGFTYAPCW